MAQDTNKDQFFPESPLEEYEFPPSYDSSLATGAGPSQPVGSTGAAQGRTIPEHIRFLFTGPTNAEPLLGSRGHDLSVRERVKRVEWVKKGDQIQSTDPKLSDPDLLYDWLRLMAMEPPKVTIQCSGSHMETCEQDTLVMQDGTHQTLKRGETQTIVDFDFTIDLSEIVNHPDNISNIHLYTALPWDITQRGTHRPSYSASYRPPKHYHGPLDNAVYADENELYESLLTSSDGFNTTLPGLPPKPREQKKDRKWKEYRRQKGIPGWVKREDVPEFEQGKGKGKGKNKNQKKDKKGDSEGGSVDLDDQDSDIDVEQARNEGINNIKPNLRAWCQAYCDDRGLLKEFVMKKELCGWDFDGLKSAVNGAILSTGYQSPYVAVNISIDNVAVVVRPNNLLSRALSNPWIYFLSWLFMIYPFIWIWKHFHSLGGAPWDVAFVSYALKFYPPLPSTFPSEPISSASDRLPSLPKLHPELPPKPQLQYGPKGIHYLVGRKEGEWFREWEERIRMGVRMRYKGELQGGTVEETRVELDGY
ncbi:hypothetical protein J010_06701 [Cryptococcus neoformans]|nr:hypothetical protein C355_06714 [Cryptococcus neoformans var. grubii Th84]OXH00577.1 hypothetical protein J010_06701 [Cryptococcus neoformans var. grubii]OXH22273.1 hypothetical protein J009_06688 [Cryptococcus neoformans var. grubii]OXH42254.1 hypothetical protein J004_06732 [Cryptococcus neoformans var. grubii]OXH42877.1 hypothetical protein J003_06687 [Cryptococcus neoformans var. grubii]